MLKSLSYCTNCRTDIEDEERILYVDESFNRGFCSESCIEQYFSPMIEKYTNIELFYRKKYDLMAEPCHELLNEELPEEVLTAPTELYAFARESYETLYSFICTTNTSKFGMVSFIGLGLIMEGQFSFLFMVSCSQNASFIDEFRTGEKVEVSSKIKAPELGELSQLNEEDLGNIELKKSEFLASLMSARKDSDIPFEDFAIYDDYLSLTIENPDEIYEQTDSEGDELQVLVKSFEREGLSFYYFAICMIKQHSEQEFTVIPFISFPTIDPDLHKKYCSGKNLTGNLLN